MRSLRLMAPLLVLTLVAVSCGDDAEEPAEEQQVATTTRPTAPVVDEPSETTTTPTTTPTLPPTTLPATTDTEPPLDEEPAAVEPTVAPGTAPPVPPGNISCAPGNNEGEVYVEFNALPDPSEVSRIRVYAGPAGERPLPMNGEFTMGQVDTTRSGGTRWAVPARGLPTGIQLDLAATSFNLLDQESGWYIASGVYRGPGQSCAADGSLPAPTGTVGFEEEAEVEPTP